MSCDVISSSLTQDARMRANTWCRVYEFPASTPPTPGIGNFMLTFNGDIMVTFAGDAMVTF